MFSPAIEGQIRNHAKLRRAGPRTIDAFIELVAQVLAAHPNDIEIRPTKQFIPFSLIMGGQDRNLTDVIAVREGEITLALKTCEPEYPFLDPQRKTQMLRPECKEWRFSGYQREIKLCSHTDVPYICALVLQCFENLSARRDLRTAH